MKCPFCWSKIYVDSKEDREITYMWTGGNADFVRIKCPTCGEEFHIYEETYDKLIGA